MLAACTQAARCAPAPIKVLFFGDSITVGQFVDPSQRWTTLVTARSGGAFVEVNEGKGGRPTAAIDEFSAVVEKDRADPAIAVLVIALGGNDARDTSAGAVDKATANLARMVAIARDRAPRWQIVLCTPYSINKDALGPTHAIGPIREKNLLGMGRAFKALAARQDLPLIDMYPLVPPQTQTRDGVHPTAAGHAAIAAQVGPILNRIVAEVLAGKRVGFGS